MEQKDKELLLRYLSMALPYKVKVCLYERETCILTGIDECEVYLNVDSDSFRIESIKPYLRPISSMTMEEDEERIRLGIWKSNQYNGQIVGIFQDIAYANPLIFQSALIWLLQNHFDIFGLIPARLAIEVTKENNPYI